MRDRDRYGNPVTEPQFRDDLAEGLRAEVAAMNPENFIVRPKRRFVERFSAPEPWRALGDSDRHELATQVAGLPTEALFGHSEVDELVALLQDGKDRARAA